ncbi:MAG: tetratricopeptide (TPR) repeat protein, partial [Myxococcota bacterium]
MSQRFTVVGELGSGGQGRVLAVRDAARDDAVLALKETPATGRGALQREFGLLARLRHPNLVTVYDWFATTPLGPAAGPDSAASRPAAYTQELVEGTDLWRALRGAPSETQESVLEQVLSALAYLHALDVVHLDLKPENVLVTPAEGGALARVLDFGIARPIGGSLDVVQGSFSYIAPELLLHGAFDQRADLFGFGVMMVEVATGKAPNPADLRGRLANADARRTAFRDLGVPSSWLEATVQLCDPEPSLRPANAQATAALWGLGRRANIELVTPAAVQAIVRAGPPVGQAHIAQAVSAMLADEAGGALLVCGGAGSGRRTALRHLTRLAQTQGQHVEWWPHGNGMRNVRAFGQTLARLFETPALAAVVQRSASTWVEGSRDGRRPGAGAVGDALAERVAKSVVDAICALKPSGQRPFLAIHDIDGGPELVRRVVLGLVEAATAGRALPLHLVATTTEAKDASGPGSPTLSLAPLDTDAVESFLATRFGRHDGSRRLAAALVVASGGQPLGLETLLGLIAARGDLQLGVSGWEWLGDADTIALPRAATVALGERIALLDGPVRETLETVAWCRFRATAITVASALGQEAAPLRSLLELASAGLLWRDADGRFGLAHPGLDAVLKTEGRGLRGGAAAAHERVLVAGGLTPLSKAWHVGGDAGTDEAYAIACRAWQAGDADAAARALDVALELRPDRPDILRMRANVADLLGPRELQLRCLERLKTVLPLTDPARLDAVAALFWTLTRVGDVPRAMAVGEEVIALARESGQTHLLAEVLVHRAIAVTQRGDYDEAETHLAEARALVDAEQELGLTARIENNLGNIFAYREQHTEALTHYGAAHALKTREGDPVGVRIAVGNMGLMCLRLGRSAEAIQHFAASYAAAKRTGHRRGLAWSLCALSELGLNAGAWTYAVRRARGALEEADALGDRLIACDAETTLAEATLALGQVEQAVVYARSGLTRAVDADNGFTAARARLLLAIAGAGDAVPMDIAEDAQADDTTRARAWCLVAEHALVAGDLKAAKQAAVEAAALSAAPAVLASIWQTHRQLGETAAADMALRKALHVIAAATPTWPDAPAIDGVERNTASDAPSRATYRARPDVELLMADATTAPPPDQFASKDSVMTLAANATSQPDDRSLRLLASGAHADRAALLELLAQAVDAWVAAVGAERAFVVSDDRILTARNADAERIADAEKKLPSAAADGALRTKAVWRAADASGRGTLAAVPINLQVGDVTSVVVAVFQNRFVADAFDGDTIEAVPAAVAPLLRMMLQDDALKAATKRAVDAESQRRTEMTRTTEEILMLRRDLESTREQLGPSHAYQEIVFASTAMRKMLRQVDRIVETDLPVQIHGESGTGKELVARAIHANGARSRGPFVAQNCSAIPHDLFESEFFGHEKGAFTGASRATDGLFRRASGGTLFLDEIGDLPLSLQSKLLRVLETSEVRPVGGSRTFRVDVRVISATHH